MADFGLIRSFQIDHGELDGMSPQECFVLGYELAQIDAQLETGEAINRLIHANNRARIEKSCEDAVRPCHISWMAGDPSESWATLHVPAAQAKS